MNNFLDKLIDYKLLKNEVSTTNSVQTVRMEFVYP